MDNTKNIRVLSLCSGYGGIELALAGIFDAPLKVVTVEIESFAVANLVAKAEQNKLAVIANYTDIKTFPAEKFRGCFDIITAGYPCQPFSHAGKRKGSDDPRHLWPYIRDAISFIRPELCFFENVAGHVELGLREVLLDLEELGYRVETPDGQPTWGLFTAAEIGAPHKRQRLFILAYDNNRAGNSTIIKKSIRQAQPESGDDSRERGLSGIQETKNGSDSIRRPDEVRNIKRVLDEDGGNGKELENSGRLGRRGGSDGESGGQGRPLQTTGPSELDDPQRTGLSKKARQIQRKRESVSKNGQRLRDVLDTTGSSELVKPDSNGHSGHTESEEVQSERRTEAAALSGGEQLADTDKKRTQRPEPERAAQTGRQIDEQSYPARPGQPQYEWEKPRTVKPGMGRTVNGFKSRVDELRLLGNGVVPATAELAFRTLTEKI